MSDLAPFVAAALKDKTVIDLLEENQKLRQNLAKTRVVEVTGPGGSPVYAKGKMNQGECTAGGENWTVYLVQGSPCPLDQLSTMEIRLGGIPQLDEHTLDDTPCMPLDFIIGCFDEQQMGLFEIVLRGGQNLAHVQARVGPFHSHYAYSNIDHLNRDENGEFLCSHLVKLMKNTPGVTVTVHQIDFSLPRIQGVLENQGLDETTLVQQHELTKKALLRHLSDAEEDEDTEKIAYLTHRLQQYGYSNDGTGTD